MSRTVFHTATTLDGYLADEHDSLAWLFKQEHDEEGPLSFGAFFKGVGAIAMGATTYQWLLDHMAASGEAWSFEQPTWVFTHRTFPEPDADVRFTSADVRDVHAEMVAAADGRDVWVCGGGGLATQFAAAGLLDEVVVAIAPVTLGAGRPLFPGRFDLRLTELAQNGAFACARYDVVGPLAE